MHETKSELQGNIRLLETESQDSDRPMLTVTEDLAQAVAQAILEGLCRTKIRTAMSSAATFTPDYLSEEVISCAFLTATDKIFAVLVLSAGNMAELKGKLISAMTGEVDLTKLIALIIRGLAWEPGLPLEQAVLCRPIPSLCPLEGYAGSFAKDVKR